MTPNRAYRVLAFSICVGLILLSVAAGACIQTYIHYLHDFLGNREGSATYLFYGNCLDGSSAPAFQVTLLPSLLLAVYLLGLERFTAFSSRRYLHLAIGSALASGLAAAFVLVSLSASLDGKREFFDPVSFSGILGPPLSMGAWLLLMVTIGLISAGAWRGESAEHEFHQVALARGVGLLSLLFLALAIAICAQGHFANVFENMVVQRGPEPLYHVPFYWELRWRVGEIPVVLAPFLLIGLGLVARRRLEDSVSGRAGWLPLCMLAAAGYVSLFGLVSVVATAVEPRSQSGYQDAFLYPYFLLTDYWFGNSFTLISGLLIFAIFALGPVPWLWRNYRSGF